DAVPADARIIECASMKAEEAALTGESVPVLKTSDAISAQSGEVPLGDRKNMVFMGSTVVYGTNGNITARQKHKQLKVLGAKAKQKRLRFDNSAQGNA
ncbi:MAG: hypothetical protein PUI02_04070, partial [Christensenellaceae bacterium]|nr:hypothetical protein [Christensenellaceae bacterium]